ncbi:MAG TPA: hypothetical protein VMT73_11945, partial [Anaerolineales bacterium]|nr:hypothetical protein [Anaerolineales bacterium]
MSDVILFLNHGWKSIWKQQTIWLFSALQIVYSLLNIFLVGKTTTLLFLFVWLLADIIAIVLILVSYIGVPYLAYCFLTGRPATVRETLSAVKKFSGRVIGCSFLAILALTP